MRKIIQTWYLPVCASRWWEQRMALTCLGTPEGQKGWSLLLVSKQKQRSSIACFSASCRQGHLQTAYLNYNFLPPSEVNERLMGRCRTGLLPRVPFFPQRFCVETDVQLRLPCWPGRWWGTWNWSGLVQHPQLATETALNCGCLTAGLRWRPPCPAWKLSPQQWCC